MNPALLTLFTFLGGVCLVAGIYSILSDLYLRDRSRVGRRVDEEFRTRQREKVRQSPLFKNFNELTAEAETEEWGTPGIRKRFETMVEQSGLSTTPKRLLMIAGAAGLGLGAIAGLIQGVLAGIVVALVAAAVPLVYVRIKQKARSHKLLTQLPDAFDLMARMIRAGHTMSQSLQGVADEFDAPIAAEFAYCYEQQNLGLDPERALRDLARRTDLIEMKIFVLALMVQQQTGGNLADILEKLASVVRDRFRVLGKIRALTAEGRFQAAVLLAMPPVLFIIILALNRSYGQILFDHPLLLVNVVVLELLGALWIRKIVNFDF